MLAASTQNHGAAIDTLFEAITDTHRLRVDRPVIPTGNATNRNHIKFKGERNGELEGILLGTGPFAKGLVIEQIIDHRQLLDESHVTINLARLAIHLGGKASIHIAR